MRRRTLTSKRIRCGSQTAKKLTTYDKYWRIVGGVSIGLTSMLGVMMICPMVSSSTNALDNTTRSANTTVTVDAAATLAVSLDPKVEMEISPDSAGTFSYGTAKLGVMTNNPTGYSIYMQTADGKSTLNNDKVTGGQVINSITANTVGSSFTGNTWGYTLDTNTVTEASTYKPVPTSSDTAIKSTAASTNTDNYNLGFGAHIDNTLASGAYYNDVLVSVVANPKVISSLSDLSFMQDMNSEICANTAEGYTKQLIDTRDNKSYWVAKLKDGNCWMTQNLALDITTEGLKASDTDIARDWTATQSADPSVTTFSPPKATLSIGQSGGTASYGEAPFANSWKGAYLVGNHDSVGNYYTWYAAVAGTGNDSSASSHAGTICPKSWTIPDSLTDYGSLSDIYDMYGAHGMVLTNKAPLYYVSGGLVSPDGDEPGNGVGYYWTTSTSSGSYSFAYVVGSSSGSDGSQRENGASVRCVAR